MAFPKAYKIPNTPEYQEYVSALLKYKIASKDFARMKKAFKNSAEPLKRLLYYEAVERYSEASKEYQKAREVYAAHSVTRRIREDAVRYGSRNLGADEMAELLKLTVPMKLSDILKEQKQKQIAESISEEEFQTVRDAAMKYMAESTSVKDQFLGSSTREEEDPTLGDWTIPPDKVKTETE
jgi:hypothetical protein